MSETPYLDAQEHADFRVQVWNIGNGPLQRQRITITGTRSGKSFTRTGGVALFTLARLMRDVREWIARGAA